MNPLGTYFKELSEIRPSGVWVKETSYYEFLANLLDEIGKTFKPKVECITNLKNRGAGLLNGGLFPPDQFQKAAMKPLPGIIPACGIIELKPVRVMPCPR